MLALGLLVLLLAGCVPAPASTGDALAVTQPASVSISPEALAQQYGVRVNLVALTAVGGLVDVRLGIVDAAKAQQLMRGQAPSLLLADGRGVLPPPEDSRAQAEQLRDGIPVLMLYPNKGAAVKRGDKITVQFGDVRLQPVVVQ